MGEGWKQRYESPFTCVPYVALGSTLYDVRAYTMNSEARKPHSLTASFAVLTVLVLVRTIPVAAVP